MAGKREPCTLRSLKIPQDLFVSVLNDVCRSVRHCADNLTPSDWERVKISLGKEFSHLPGWMIAQAGINARKQGILDPVNGGRGPSKASDHKTPQWYVDYLKSDHWKDCSNSFKRYWDNRCSVCYGLNNIEVHHRTYDRIGSERITDCIVLCKKCHKLFSKNGRLCLVPQDGPTERLFSF